MTDDLESLGNALKVLRYIFAKLAKLASTVGATLLCRGMGDDFASKMLGQGLACGLAPGSLVGGEVLNDVVRRLV
jgi:hypothetical protein